MSLTRRSIETLLDLVEIKLSCMEILDREDQREQTFLERCREELAALMTSGKKAAVADISKTPKAA